MNPFRDLSDAELLAQCRVETLRGSGPGGQHRNKVESVVRLTHLPTGTVVKGSERRSQHANLRLAVGRLRARLEKLYARAAPRVATRKSRGTRAREREAKQRASRKKLARRAGVDD